jgi:dTDP-4-dehydrorhamnose reductase
MKLKILILGSTGLIGHQVYNHLERTQRFDLHNIAYRKKINNKTILCDVRDEKEFLDTIKSIKPDIIINCIGILIKGANLDPENAIFINSYMPHRLMRLANEINSKLIHISTDCVFSGNKQSAYVENDFKDGLDSYAKTKGIGEIINETHLTLRTSVVGPELKTDGEELFHWFMSQNEVIKGFTKAVWSGITTLELAKAVEWAITNEITGLYHLTNNMSINKNELLKLFKKHTNKNIEIDEVDGTEVDKSFIDTRKLIDYEIPNYDIMISEMVELINENQKIYSHYINKGNFF